MPLATFNSYSKMLSVHIFLWYLFIDTLNNIQFYKIFSFWTSTLQLLISIQIFPAVSFSYFLCLHIYIYRWNGIDVHQIVRLPTTSDLFVASINKCVDAIPDKYVSNVMRFIDCVVSISFTFFETLGFSFLSIFNVHDCFRWFTLNIYKQKHRSIWVDVNIWTLKSQYMLGKAQYMQGKAQYMQGKSQPIWLK